MKYGLSDTVIKKIINVFENNANINEAIIFGSRALGSHREGSDIDITLKGSLTFDHLLRIESQLDHLMLPYQFDLSLFESIDSAAFVNHIHRVGKVFYSNVANCKN